MMIQVLNFDLLNHERRDVFEDYQLVGDDPLERFSQLLHRHAMHLIRMVELSLATNGGLLLTL